MNVYIVHLRGLFNGISHFYCFRLLFLVEIEENCWPFCQVRTCILTSWKFLSEGDGNKRELQWQIFLTLAKQAALRWRKLGKLGNS